jgi:hypothetical protein
MIIWSMISEQLTVVCEWLVFKSYLVRTSAEGRTSYVSNILLSLHLIPKNNKKQGTRS